MYEKGDVVWIKSDQDSVEYANAWFDGYLGPYLVTRTIKDSDWIVYVSRMDGTLWLDENYSTILPEHLRPDEFLNAVRKAVRDDKSKI